MIIIDGKDLVLGRLASFVAKRLLEGEHVTVVNSEQVVISGRKEATFDVYDAWLEVRNITNPRKGPFHLKRADELVRRTIRGMLPFDKPKGKAAYRCLRVYVGMPQEFAGKEIQTLPEASIERLGTRRFIRIETLSKHLGARF